LGGRGRQISEFQDSLVYRVSSRTARAIHREKPCLGKKRKKKKKRHLTEVRAKAQVMELKTNAGITGSSKVNAAT
jgi:hypothetical protein